MSSAKPEDDRAILQPFGCGSDATAITGPATSASPMASGAGASGDAPPAGTEHGECELTAVIGEGGFDNLRADGEASGAVSFRVNIDQ